MEDLLSELHIILNHEPIVKQAKTRLSDDEIEAVADEQLEFLNLLFPFLGSTKFRYNYQNRIENLNLELRAMKRFNPEGSSAKKGTARYTSFNTFRLDETCKEYLMKYIRQCNRSKFQLCEYLVFSAFDKNIAKNADTEPSKLPSMCNATNTAMIQSLMLDFDKITKEEFIEHYTRLRQLGLEFLVVFTGHGYQIHFLLDQPTRDVHSLKAFVRLAISMGYPVDGGANTISQLERMPKTLNSKAYDPKFGYELEVIQTEWLIKTNKRYSLDELFLTISENQCSYDESWDALSLSKPLPVNTADEDFLKSEQLKIKEKIQAKIKLENIKKEEKEKKKVEKKKEKEEKVEKKAKNLGKSSSKKPKKDMEVSFMAINLGELYPMIRDIDSHAIGVQNILKGPQKGIGNISLKFIVAYFKTLEYSLDEVLEITDVWRALDTFGYASQNRSEIEAETERFYNKGYKVASSDVPALEDVYGELFDEDGNFYSLKDKVIFDNDNFCKLREITPTAFLLLCSIKANDLRENTKYYTENDLAELVLKTEKTVRTHMNKLVDLGIAKVEKRKPEGKKGGRPTKYYSLTEIDIEEIKYTKVDVSKIEALLFRTFKSKLIKEPLSDRAFMVALYIRYRAFGNRKSCYMKQQTMADEMGIGRTQLTNAMTELEKHKLIKKKKHDVFTTLEYIIMY
ncbi:MAG: helix-turn-helix domain-containing protein [Bacteroidales bacterium]|nr:helix-turn-helix domain-containing protein [Bacteroidales bacterium]